MLLYEVPRVIKFFKTESRMVVAKRWREGNVKSVFNGYRFQLGEDEKVLEMDGGDATTIM